MYRSSILVRILLNYLVERFNIISNRQRVFRISSRGLVPQEVEDLGGP